MTVSGSMTSRTAGGLVTGERLHALDGLRAVAALLVVFHHLVGVLPVQWLNRLGLSVLEAWFSGFTSSGVELFFVLSGIVLLRPLATDPGRFHLGGYIRRRIERLWPPFLVAWLLSALSVAAVSHWPSWWTVTSGVPAFSLVEALKQLPIVYFGHEWLNFAWWSLTVEVLFYGLIPVLIPVAVWLHRAPMRGLVWYAAAILLAVSAAVAGVAPGGFGGLMIYAACFAGGVLLASTQLPRSVALTLLLVGLLGTLADALWGPFNRHLGWGLVHTGLAALALRREDRWLDWLSTPRMVWLGERSYSLFLIHFAVIVMVCHGVSLLVEGRGLVYVLASRGLALLLIPFATMLLFHGVERRFARNLSTADQFWPPCGAT